MNASNSIQANIRLQQLEQQNFLLNTQLAQANENPQNKDQRLQGSATQKK